MGTDPSTQGQNTEIMNEYIYIAEGSYSIEDIQELIRNLLPNYPNATLFRTEYLDFFSEDSVSEKNDTIEDEGSYFLFGDFDGDNYIELAATGLIDTTILDGKYEGFCIIIEIEEDQSIGYFINLWKTVGEDGSIQNLVLYQDYAGLLTIGFDYGTGYLMNIEYDENEYQYRVYY